MTRNEYQNAVRCFTPDPSLRDRVSAAVDIMLSKIIASGRGKNKSRIRAGVFFL